MWNVYEQKFVTKCLIKIPREIQLKYKAWIEIVKNGGCSNLRNYPGFKDEKLKGDLMGYRSSRLSIKYRIVYIENANLEEITVTGITANDYKRGL